MGIPEHDDERFSTGRAEFNEGWGETIEKINQARERGEGGFGWAKSAPTPGAVSAEPPAIVAEAIGCIEWYVRCLDDVRRQIPVRGLDEAEAGYVRALATLRGAVSRGLDENLSKENDNG